MIEWFSTWLTAMPGAVAQGMMWGIMAIGLYITFKVLDIADLTVDGSICTGMVVCATLITKGCNIWLAMLAAMLAGMLAGALTGIFLTVMGIQPILAGILTQLMLWSINLKILGGKANLSLPARNYDLLVTGLKKPRAIAILAVFAVVIILLLYWFFGTKFGASVRATGCNAKMARAQGINTEVNRVFGLALSNGFVALAGSLLAQYSGSADINNGRGAIVIGLAAIIIGEAIFSRFTKNFIVRLLSVVVGGVVYYIVYQTVICLKIDTDLLKMLSALVVAVFLAIPYWKKKYFTKAKTGRAENITGAKEDERDA